MNENEVSRDKKCRLCGFSDVNNKNIFTSFGGDLITKIHTVYPILLYQNDPLPKNICNKCVSTVNLQYNEVTRIVKQQKIWTDNIRKQQPENNFLKIINFIQDASSEYQKSIKFNFDENISTNLLNRFLLLTDEMSSTQKVLQKEHKEVNNSAACSTTDTASEVDDSSNLNGNNIPTPNVDDNKSEIESTQNEVIALENVKAILQDNDNKEDVKKELIELNTNNSETVNIKEEDLKLNSQTNNVEAEKTDISNSVTCRYCSNLFSTDVELAMHQVEHMRLNVPKIFKRKRLSKSLRRARLSGGRNVRCTSCWQIYVDRPAIVNHWTSCECDYFCAICGKLFIDKPILLQQHILDEHEITYHSLKKQKELLKKLRKGADYNTLRDQCRRRQSRRANLRNRASTSNSSGGNELSRRDTSPTNGASTSNSAASGEFSVREANSTNDASTSNSAASSELSIRRRNSRNGASTSNSAEANELSVRRANTRNIASTSNSAESGEVPIRLVIARAEAAKPEFLENSDGLIMCEICSHPFKSLKGRNSHMKVHKRRQNSQENEQTLRPVVNRIRNETVTTKPDDANPNGPPSKKLQATSIGTDLNSAKNNTAKEENNKDCNNEMEKCNVVNNNECKKISSPITNINSNTDKNDIMKNCTTSIKTDSETKVKSAINSAEHLDFVSASISKNIDEDKQKNSFAKRRSCSATATSTTPIKEEVTTEITRVNCINTKISTIPPVKIPTNSFSQSQFNHKPTNSRSESLNNNCFSHSNISSTLSTHSPISNISFISPNDNATITNNNQLYNLLMNANDNFTSRIPETNLPYNNLLYSSLMNNSVNYGHANEYTSIGHNLPGNTLGSNNLNFGCTNVLPNVANHNLPFHPMMNNNLNYSSPNDLPRIMHNNHPNNPLIYSPTNNNITNYACNLPCTVTSESNLNYSNNSTMGICATNSQSQRPITKRFGIRTKYVEPRGNRFPKPGETSLNNGQNNAFPQQQSKQA